MSKDTYKNLDEYTQEYDKEYYDGGGCSVDKKNGYDKKYSLQNKNWFSYFDTLSDEIINNFNPQKTIDVGCAKGFLVEMLRDKGIEAYGIEVSKYALSTIRSDIKQYCKNISILEDIQIEKLGKYDCVSCIEVLEHIPQEFSKKAVLNLTKLAGNIFFSSTPDDYTEKTHVNVQNPEYWISIFNEYNYYIDPFLNLSNIIPHALNFSNIDIILNKALKFKPFKDRLSMMYGDNFNLKKFLNNKDKDFNKILYNLILNILSVENLKNEEIDIINEINKKVSTLNLSLIGSINENRNLKLVLKDKEDYITDLNKSLNIQTNHLKNIQSSLTWKLYLKYNAVKNIFNILDKPSEKKYIGSCLIINGGYGDTYRYRALFLKEQFEKLEYNCQIIFFENEILSEKLEDDIYKYDFIVLQRVPINEKINLLLDKVKGKIPIIYDIDDLIFNTKYISHRKGLSVLDNLTRFYDIELYNRYRYVMNQSDYILTSTDSLKDQILKNFPQKKVFINRNAIGEEIIFYSEKAFKEISSYKRSNEYIIIGYASGSKTHNEDFSVINESLFYIFKKYKNVHLVIIGELDISSELEKYNKRIIKVPFLSWKELPFWLARFDINLSPLENNIFCEAKSELKYFESALVRVPTIASELPSFRYAIKQGKTGFLAKNTEDWSNALEKLILDARLRKKMGENAYIDVINRYTIEERSKKLSEILLEIKKTFHG
jgi:glycosyltransferase involved in cell wall biosynthesis